MSLEFLQPRSIFGLADRPFAMAIAPNELEHSSGDDDGIFSSTGNVSTQDHNEKISNDLEVSRSRNNGSVGDDDPFGDETNAEVKYRTMTWWSVTSFKYLYPGQLKEGAQAGRNEYAVQARTHE